MKTLEMGLEDPSMSQRRQRAPRSMRFTDRLRQSNGSTPAARLRARICSLEEHVPAVAGLHALLELEGPWL